MLDDSPTEIHIGQLPGSRLHVGDTLVGHNLCRLSIQLLHQQAARNAHILLEFAIVAVHVHLQQTQVLLRGQHLQSAL